MKYIRDILLKYKDLFLLVLLSFIPLLWYGNQSNMLITSHDVGYLLNPIELLKVRSSTWVSSVDFGLNQLGWMGFIPLWSLEAILTAVGGSVFVGQKILVVFWFFIPMFTMYLAVKHTPEFKDKRYMPLLAAVLYGFNFFQIQGWVVLWQARFSTYTALPLVFFLLIDCFEQRRSVWKTSVFLGLIIFFFNGGGSPPLFGALILLVLTIVGFYFCVSFPLRLREFILKTIWLFLIAGSVCFLLSAYWLLPYIYYALTSYTRNLSASGGIDAGIAWTNQVSRNASIINLIRLQGFDFFEKTSDYSFVLPYLTNFILIAVSFIWPILAFVALLLANAKKKKMVFFITILALIAIPFTAGSHAPFKEFYTLLLRTVPGFPIFRTALYKFGELLWFAYAILVAFTLSSIIEKGSNFFLKNSQKLKDIISPLFFTLTVIIIITWNYPILTNQYFNWKPPLSTLEKIPQYVLDFGKFADKENITSERTLLLPELNPDWKAEVFKWQYWSLSTVTSLLTRANTLSNDGILNSAQSALTEGLYRSIRNNDQNWTRLAGLLGVRKLLLRNDVFYDLDWCPTTPPGVYKAVLDGNNSVKKISTAGAWDLYTITGGYLPIFYVPISVTGAYTPETSAFTLMANNSEREMLIFPASLNNLNKNFSPDTFSKEIIQADCILCSPMELQDDSDHIGFPPVRFLPGSLLYSYISFREARLMKSYQDIPGSRIDVDLSFVTRRFAELKLLTSPDRSNKNPQLIASVVDKNKQVINDAIEQTKKLGEAERNFYLIRILTYLQAEYKMFDFDSLTDVPIFLKNKINEISKNIWATTNPENKKFLVQTKSQGDYALVIPGKKDLPKNIYVDGKQVDTLEHLLLNSGIHRIELQYPAFMNLLQPKIQNNPSEYVLSQNPEITFGIENFTPEESYQIAFDYRLTSDSPVNFTIEQDNDKLNQDGTKNRAIKQTLERDGNWYTKSYTFIPNHYANSAALIFKKVLNSDTPVLELQNFKIIKNIYPQVYLYLTDKIGTQTTPVPKISFQRVNQTVYWVHVENANKPFFLNFNEQYDAGWKVYEIGPDTRTANAKGAISYYKGDITEFSATDTGVSIDFLKTLFLKPIPEKNHLESNGYANSWYLEKQGTYDMIITYYPQWFYYFGSILSLITLALIAGTIFIWKK